MDPQNPRRPGTQRLPANLLHAQRLEAWTNKNDHEGYQAGYFIEAAIAHYMATERKDDRMLRAARRLADCWYDHIGPARSRRGTTATKKLNRPCCAWRTWSMRKTVPAKETSTSI